MTSSATAASRRARLRRVGASVFLACGLSVVATTVSAAPAAARPAQAPAPAAPTVIGLKRGSRGESVKVVQQALIRAGVSVLGGADGIFGPATEQAVRRFQRSEGKRVTGVVDAATAQALGLTSTTASLAVGARGDAVKRLQQALLNAGVRVLGGADGVFGAATQAAVKAFQQNRGLQQTGAVDGATAAALGLGGDVSRPQGPSSAAPSGGYVGLRLGSRGAAVTAIQRAIMATGLYLRGGADGVFGTATRDALMLVQRVNGIPTTGVVDAATLRVLQIGRPAPTAPARLQPGARGNAVKLLQQSLLSAGIRFAGGADGIFGPATEAAVKQFQSSKGLPATGRVDERTATALRLGGQPAPSPSGYVGLRLGSRGEYVRAVQQAIMATGLYLRGGADGIFGTATQSALMIYQRTNGLGASGVVDAATARLMGLGGSTPPPSGGTAPGYAVYDERGARVVALQSALIRAGIPVPGGADGVFGSSTAAAVVSFQRARGLSATGKVDQATANALGLQPMDKPWTPPATSVRLDAKPVQGPCWMADSWHAPRGNGRVHLGVDIIAGSGQQLYAVATGEISQIYRDYPGALAGNGLKIRRPDGTYFFYAHLLRFAPGIKLGADVRAGQVVGYVGNTGNSATAHLHLEVHPLGGAAVDPYPIVKAIGAC